ISQLFEYSKAASLADALKQIDDGAKPIAGGMSLIPLMKLRLAAPDRVVDIGQIGDLNYIKEVGGEIHVGATTTHHQIESSAVLRGKCPLLAEVASWIGDVQVRNMGTIGGSVAHADPSADYPAALLALEAKFVLASSKGERTVGATDFFLDMFTTALEPGELIREVIVPVEAKGTGTSYQKMVQPASGFAIVGVAARVSVAGGKVTMARIGVTGVAPTPYRATKSEEALVAADADKAAALASDGVEANTDIHASANYRLQMAKVYCARAIRTAMSRA
ncbi:MAG: xanthine dehydrogenase family protein subunit M, partial [Bryobacteraceae bacterium]